MECTAFSIPAPERVVWTFEGREVNVHDQDYSILEDPLPEGIKSTLIIRESQEKHFGMYNCSVSNPYGTDVVEINLMPQSKLSFLLLFFSFYIVFLLTEKVCRYYENKLSSREVGRFCASRLLSIDLSFELRHGIINV